MKIQRKQTREIVVGNKKLGGDNPILIQSMTNTNTLNTAATKAQIESLISIGCEVVRIATSSLEEVAACKPYLKKMSVPLVADIQFDYRLAVAAADAGFDAIRFNPGNIGNDKNVAEVVSACKKNNLPIRIGVNAGSLEKDIEKEEGKGAEGLVKSVMRHVSLLEKHKFYDIVLSAKSSSTQDTIATYRKLSALTDYPLHLGVTESGSGDYGRIKSAIGIGALLADGIGDTIRVSLTGDPMGEIIAAKMILKASGIASDGVEIISCPTCSRCKIDLESICKIITEHTQNIEKPLKIAIMGCVVNGPGEAKDADVGVACGIDKSAIFQKGKVLKTVENEEIIGELKKLIAAFE
ncbi:MAG: flavodoxin-dependent (E)-4-hydroxy-3-methylbut-2-enyl-diphosphate synthase [Firmicutes bacterium]|nr:flavodoxin-dependent (E)-4-hydroxy-3-methylbut-2-enyl-diphosphate synthase [Bacillota bacterium]